MNTVLTTRDALDRRADDDHVGLLFEDESWTWRQFVSESRRRANMMLALHDDARPFHIGVMLENEPEFLFLVGAAAYSGATAVGVNFTRRGEELARDIRFTDVEILVTTSELMAHLDGADIGISSDRVLLLDDPAYADLLGRHSDDRPDVESPGDPQTQLLLMFTSGSTGSPKAVICSTGRMARTIDYAHMGVTRDDIPYNCMPLFHGNALFACWAPAVNVGAAFAMARRFSASRFVPDLIKYNVTYFNYVGRALAYLLAQPEREEEAHTRLRACFGTEASDLDRREFHRRFGVWPTESYGSSEGGLSISRTEDSPPGSLGLPHAGTDAAVMNRETMTECPRALFDEKGRIRNADEATGELVNMRGAAGFEGYYRDQAAMDERIRGEIFLTGDLGYRDEQGYFYYAGRGSDRLRVDSENFSAAPIERILARFDHVQVALVYPVPDARTGDQVMATLQIADPTSFDPAAFAEFLAAQSDLGAKWAPRYVRVVEDVPVTATRKVDKPRLRRHGWDVAEPVYYRPTAALTYTPIDAGIRDDIAQRFAECGRANLVPEGQTKEMP
ncbi:AMP-binding protein [Gordonia liuliyuniae]|uniref:AMP-binding protein n=1 Tax=Gordonia liuliyuniae TaxID=2911517 RepID=A0ABS9ITL5_9ACTN|nr:AMP-binding protein [Gordonia liuliyuniae]MCF8588850.1 AMP-binding protein [Gordonia liuliyuniae]